MIDNLAAPILDEISCPRTRCRRGAEPAASLEALLPQVDLLTCHTPLTGETRAMINPRTLGLLKRPRRANSRSGHAKFRNEFCLCVAMSLLVSAESRAKGWL